MAILYPVATASYSLVVWNNDATGAAYGSTPGTGDTILLNGKTITLNQNISVTSIGTFAGTTAVAGGVLTVPTAGFTVTFTGNITPGTTAACTVTHTSGTTTFNGGGTVNPGPAGTTTYGINFTSSAGGTLNITANATGGSVAFGAAINHGNASGTINFTGTLTGGTTTNAYGAQNGSTGTFNAIGNAVGVGGIAFINNVGGNANLTGNATGGSGSGAHGAYNNGAGKFIVNGNCTGGPGSSTNSAGAANNISTGSLIVNGNVNATAFYAGVASTDGYVEINGTLTNHSSGVAALRCPKFTLGPSSKWVMATPATSPPTYGSGTNTFKLAGGGIVGSSMNGGFNA